MVRYSIETRQQVLEAVEDGDAIREVASRFGVSESFVRRLVRRKSETGSIAPLPRTNAGRKPILKEVHLAKLKQSVVESPLRTLREHRDAVGVECSLSVIHAAIKRLGLDTVRAAALDTRQVAGLNGNAEEVLRDGKPAVSHSVSEVGEDGNGEISTRDIEVVVPSIHLDSNGRVTSSS